MSDPATQRTHRPGPAGSGTLSDGLNAAAPRQLARLRFLGVRFHEPLSMGQAGTLIDRTNADPAYAARIEEWHARKFELYPALYRPGHVAAVPTRQEAGGKFRLPPRGDHEASATVFQKRRLEQFGGCDFPVIDALGRDQASALIRFLEAEAVVRSREFLQAQLDARAREAAPVVVPRPVQVPAARRTACFRRTAWGLAGVAGAVGLGLLIYQRMPVAPSASAPVGEVSASVPTADPAALEAARFKQAVAASQGRALKKYPALGVAGSRFNAAFLARYQQLSRQGSARLNSPDWPEKLAAECAAKLPAALQTR